MVALIALLAPAMVADLPLLSALRALAALLLTQVLPGALIWRLVRPLNGSRLEDLSMGFAIGSVLAIAAQTVAGLSRMPWLSTGISLGLVILLLGLPASRRRILEAHTSRLPWWFGPLTALTTAAAVPRLLDYFQAVPLTWSSGYRRPDVDAYLHLALSGELAHRGPVTFPWVASEPLAYHWFSHAWVANVSVVSGVSLDETLFRFMPVFLTLAVAFIVATAAVRLTGKAWTGPVAAALALAGGDLNIFGPSTARGALSPLSPSLGMSVPMLVALVVVLVCRWRGSARSGAFLLIPVLGIAAAGTKGSTLPLVVAGLGTAVGAALLFNRARLRTLVPELAVIVACFVFSVLVIFHGSAGGLRLALPTNGRQVFGDAVVVLSVLARGVGLFVLVASQQGRRDPLTWLLTGGGLAGAGAAALFSQAGGSQYYFAYSATPLLAIGSAVGLSTLVERAESTFRWPALVGLVGGVIMVWLPVQLISVGGPSGSIPRSLKLLAIAGGTLVAAGLLASLAVRHRPSAFLAAVLVTILAAGVASFVHSTAQMKESTALLPVSFKAGLAVSRDQIEAARWIRDHSSIEDKVMTNRHCTTPKAPERGCDNRRLVVAAFSERQMLLEGWTATPRSVEEAPLGRRSLTVAYWKPELLALNDGFIARPDAEAAAKLRAMGVRWVFVDFTRPHARTLEPFAHLRFRNPGAEVYELPRTG